MSICNNCPVPYEEAYNSPDEFSEADYVCDHECTFQDAVYKCQQAYDSLFARHEELQSAYEELIEENAYLQKTLDYWRNKYGPQEQRENL